MKAGVYKITNPVGQIYIGSSKEIDKRIKSHKTRNDMTKIGKSIINYGYHNHKIEVVSLCTDFAYFNYHQELEQIVIREYIEKGCFLLNDLNTIKDHLNRDVFEMVKELSPLNISGIAKETGISRGRLSKSFNSQTGKLLTKKERALVIKSIQKAVDRLTDIFSDAESL